MKIVVIGGSGLIGRVLLARDDRRPVVGDPETRYFGTAVDDASLCAADGARLGATHFADWLQQNGAGR